ALALPAHPAGLAPADVGLFGIAHGAHGGAAPGVHVADLARRHPQLGVRPFLGHQLHRGTGAAGDLGAPTGLELHGVHHGTDRDVPHRQAVAGLDVGPRAVLDPVALLHPHRGEDVALLAVGVVQQRDPGGAVRVVLDVCDLCGDTVLVVAPEVDHPVGALVAGARSEARRVG